MVSWSSSFVNPSRLHNPFPLSWKKLSLNASAVYNRTKHIVTCPFAFLYPADHGFGETCCERNRPPESGQTIFYIVCFLVWSFFIDRPFGNRQFFARWRGSQVRSHKPRNWSGILREYPFWWQNAEGCRQNSRPIATEFLGVVPGLPTFVPRISWVPDGRGRVKRGKLHTKTRDEQEPRASP